MTAPNATTLEEAAVASSLVDRLRAAQIHTFLIEAAQSKFGPRLGQAMPGLFFSLNEAGGYLQLIPRLRRVEGYATNGYFEVIHETPEATRTWEVPVRGYDWFVQALTIVVAFHHPRVGQDAAMGVDPSSSGQVQ